MTTILTTSQAQRDMSKISNSITEGSYVITSHGVGRMVILPYFDGCDENLAEYMEDFEMMQNQKVLQARYQKSSESGVGSLSI